MRLPQRRVLVGLPMTLAVWLGLCGIGLALLTVPAEAWPVGVQAVVGGALGALALVGGVPLWMFLNTAMTGQRGRRLRANAVGFEVVDEKDRDRAIFSGRTSSPVYRSARWSDVVGLVHVDRVLVVDRVGGARLEVELEGLADAESRWLVEQLKALSGRVDAHGPIPVALDRLRHAEGP